MQMSDQEIIKEIKTNACIVGMIIAGIFAVGIVITIIKAIFN